MMIIRISLFILVVYILYVLLSSRFTIEGFTGSKSISGDYDDVYIKFYKIVHNDASSAEFNTKQIRDLINANAENSKWKKDKIKVLDAGCGGGRHYMRLYGDFNVIGVDKSSQMLSIARINAPSGEFINDDLTNAELFYPDTFTHILLLEDALYHNKPKDQLIILRNCHLWLKKGGYLIIHIFDNKKLDPAPRDYSQYNYDNNKQKHSITYFDKFVHDAYWSTQDENKNIYNYNEKMILETNDHIKKVTHTFYIPDKKEIIKNILSKGFKLKNVIELKSTINVEAYDLYIFQKT